MAHSCRRLIPQSLQDRFIKLLSPLLRLFSKWGLSPNSFTFAGVVITFFAAAAFLMGYIRLAGILTLLGGLCDTIDGLLARTTGKASRFGALLDSTVDRYSEFIMFFGIAAYFFYIEDYGTSAATFLALCGSFMVSYTRARAESLGLEAKVGVMQRPERIVLIGLGALIHINAFKIAIWLVAVLANVTALQRTRFAYKQDLAEFKEDAVLKT
ncbi:MAG: CDP-alcohol phosphatidyltransferase family protein [Desulfobacterales bacterium]|nr:MAG: CDP-alcohol phosphatidyltransferase family protein [Desulfobacterales bacterium]